MMLSATDANEAAIRLCLVRWQKAWEAWEARPERHPDTAVDKGPMPTPRVVVFGDAGGARCLGLHGHSWLLRGWPTANVHLLALPRAVLSDATATREHVRALLESDAHDAGTIAAVILEPVCGATGARVDASAAAVLRDACDEYAAP